MNPLRRFSLLIVALVLGVLAATQQGRAQQSDNPRYAFADTTLLRDTLGLQFPDLFRLADSLQLAPDTLRAISVRYRWSIGRLLALADSLTSASGTDVPVDSVGPRITRDRFRWLEGRAAARQLFTYTTSYSTETQTHTRSWNNTADYSIRIRSLVVQNQITLQGNRYQGQTATNLQRHASTDVRLRVTPKTLVGGRGTFDGSLNAEALRARNDQTGIALTFQTRGRPVPWLEPAINFSGGVNDQVASGFSKR